MPADIGERGQALRFTGNGALRIAAWVTIELPEEGELNRSAAAGSGAVVSAVARVATWNVYINGIVSIPARVGLRDYLAYLGQNR